MSKQALYYYAESLPILQRAQFTDSTGKVRAIGENGRDLLVWLCNAANEKLGYTFHHSYPFIAEDSGLHISTVKRLLAGFEQLGWVTRTGEEIRYMGRGAPAVEYVLTFYPKAWTEYEKWRPSRPTSRPGATDNLGKANTGNALPEKLDTETEPEPETEPQPQPESTTSADGAREMGLGNGELLAQVIAWEVEHYKGQAGAGLLKKWRNAYPAIVARALELNPPGNLVHWCVEQYIPGRTKQRAAQTQYLPPVPKGQDNCHHGCNKGIHQFINPETDCWTSRKCVCAGGTYTGTHEPTHESTTERVSADEATITYLPTPPASADTQSPVHELTRKLQRRI